MPSAAAHAWLPADIEPTTANRTVHIDADKKRVWIALGFASFALVLALSYLVRTKPFLGAFIHERLTEEAASRNIDLEVHTIEPHGIYGLRLVGVAARVPIPRRNHAVEVQAGSIAIVPELAALVDGRLALEKVVVRDGALALVPYRRSTGKSATTKLPPSTEIASDTKRQDSPGILGAGVDVELRDLHVFVDSALKTRRAFKLKRANIAIDASWQPVGASGYGSLPDRSTFALSTERRGDENHFRVIPEERTRLDDWVAMQIPMAVEVGAFDICLVCDDVFAIENVSLHAPAWRSDVRLTTPSAAVGRERGRFVFVADEMEIQRGTQGDFAARVTASEFIFDPRERVLEGRLKLAEESGGTASVDWKLDRETIEFDIWADAFDLNPASRLLEFDLPVTPGRIDGTTSIEWNRGLGLVELELALRCRHLGIDIDRISAEPLEFEHLDVKSHVLIDVPGRVVSLSRGELVLGATRPIEFSGQVIDAGVGVAFEGRVRGESLNALTFRDGLPRSMTRIVEGAILDGDFSFELVVNGHSEFPADLELDGSLDGNVRVLEDSENADVRSLTTAGPPAQLEGADLEFWRSYEELPPIVPKVLLSAEDAAFFGHPGFDWAGFRAAMIHNLESGALERGGSTISQQVVKNLFLERHRTVARKLQEAYLTWRMENEVSKTRILEIYLNIVEWGGGARGIARAAQRYFGTDARDLVVAEIALLAAILPNPHLFGGKVREGQLPSSRMHKVGRILKNLSFLGHISLLEYRRWLRASLEGKIGRLELEVCDDDDSTDAAACW